MSEKYKFHDPEGIFFVTMTIVFWMDIFTRKELRHVLIDALKHCQKHKGLIIYAWCIMSNHIHLIVGAENGNLSGTIRDFKKFTSKQLVKEIYRIPESRRDWLMRGFARAGKRLKRINNYKVWKDGNHPILLDSNYLMDQRLNYVHMNPVVAEIVDVPEAYLYSSARNYAGEKGLLDVVLIG